LTGVLAQTHLKVANQFEPKELAEYLLLLDSNETLYNEYFWWKDYYYVETGPEQMVKRGFCELCKKLQFDDGKIKIYHAFSLATGKSMPEPKNNVCYTWLNNN